MRIANLFMVALLLSLPLAGLAPGHANAWQGQEPVDFTAIDEYVSAQMRSARIPGLALVVVEGDRIVYAGGYGQADPSGRPVTPQTSFIIGSVSKSFTALAVMQLVEAGKVQLDAPVQQYIPWFRVADPEASALITVRQLLNQTSGIPQPLATQITTRPNDLALEHAVRSLANVKPISPPGKSFAYSNGNYDTLGLIVETVSGQSYGEYLTRHVFGPLDMRNSFASQEKALQHGMASGYRWWLGFPIAATLPYNYAEVPSGYLISSAEDMGHFLIAQMNNGRYGNKSVLSADGIALTHMEPVPGTYGMGWETYEISGRTLINHDGGVPNFQASLFFDPQARVGVFVAANVCNALDTFSSPAGADWRDGPTSRGLAAGILSMATFQPQPPAGPGHARLYLVYDLALSALTVALVVSLAQIPGRYQQLEQQGISSASDFARRGIWIGILHFVWPLGVLYLALGTVDWNVLIMMYQPDLGYWLEAGAVVVFFKGLLELSLLRHLFRQTRRQRALQPT